MASAASSTRSRIPKRRTASARSFRACSKAARFPTEPVAAPLRRARRAAHRSAPRRTAGTAQRRPRASSPPRRRRSRPACATPTAPCRRSNCSTCRRARRSDVDEARLLDMADRLGGVLTEFGIKGRITEVRPGPVVTLFELEPAAGVRSSKVIALAEDIARAMSATSARVAVIPGRNAIGIELPNPNRETVYLRDLLTSNEFTRSRAALPLALGESIEGQPQIGDLGKMPHLLIAGTTGSGKSVGINAMILSLMFKLPPEKCRFIMIDPKMLELSIYEGIPHLLAPVVTDPQKAVLALKWVVREMESRYEIMSKMGVRNLAGFNQKAEEAAAQRRASHPPGPDRLEQGDRRADLRERGDEARAHAAHRGHHRRDGRPDARRRQGHRRRRAAYRPDGARRRHPPHHRHAASRRSTSSPARSRRTSRPASPTWSPPRSTRAPSSVSRAPNSCSAWATFSGCSRAARSPASTARS